MPPFIFVFPDSSRAIPAGSSLVHDVIKAGSNSTMTSTGGTNNTQMMNGNERDDLPALREEGEGCEDVESGANDDFNELNIEGALTDELKILQDRNDGLHQQMEVRVRERERERERSSKFILNQDLEVQLSHLSQEKTTLETQLQEITQVDNFSQCSI